MIGMVTSLLLAGMAQAFFGRAAGGSTLMAYVTASENLWFTTGLAARSLFGGIFALGYVMLVWDLVSSVQKVSMPEDYPEQIHRLSAAGPA